MSLSFCPVRALGLVHVSLLGKLEDMSIGAALELPITIAAGSLRLLM